MQLELTITRPDAEPVDIILDLADINGADTVRAIELCGPESFAEMARGVWNDAAADALLQAAVERHFGETIDGFSLDWGPYSGLMVEPDLTLEAGIPMEDL